MADDKIFVKIKEIEKISLAPQDVLVVKLTVDATESDMQRILENMRKIFPKNKIIGLLGDVEFQSVVPKEA